MSGTMMPPGQPPGMPPGMGAPPPMGGPQGGGGMPQLPPEVLQMLMQKMQGGGGQPGMPPPGGPPGMPPQGGPPGMMHPPMQGQQQGAPPPIPQPGQAQQMAQNGRFGDTVLAHVSPGEIMIPPEMQSPQVIAMLKQAFAHLGVSPAQFTAGSPQASKNPATGAEEFSILGALLPILGAAAGSFIPGIGTAAGAALGGAVGGAAGGLVDHKDATGVLLSAAGGGAGGYLGGAGSGLASGVGEAGAAAGSSAATGVANAAPSALAGATAEQIGAQSASNLPIQAGHLVSTAPGVASTIGQGAVGAAGMPLTGAAPGGIAGASTSASPFGSGSWGDMLKGAKSLYGIGMPAGVGAGLAGALAPAPTTDPLAKAGFNKKLGAPQPTLARGDGSPTPQFGNYNPYAAVSGPNPGYNFFPTQQQMIARGY